MPTLNELGYQDADVPLSFGVYAPTGLPAEISQSLNAKMRELAATEEMTARLRAVYAVPLSHTPFEMGKANQQDFEISGALIKAATIKLE